MKNNILRHNNNPVKIESMLISEIIAQMNNGRVRAISTFNYFFFDIK